ncbi:membrane metallo-endopeptidase-like 1 [Prorops nasuta]|uniref:membrane metallo-endopeptidase-like 1 n=1 Tax=Prorops nasuta TaxID=863751 RepID=UPI0034CEFD79
MIRMKESKRIYNILIWCLNSLTIIIAMGNCRTSDSSTNKPETVSICPTENCRNIASTLKRGMNVLVNPCDDFYQYMCGNWIEIHPLSDRESYIAWDTLMFKVVRKQLQDILTSTVNHSGTKSLQVARTLYKLCMDTKIIDKGGVKPFLKVLKEMGGFPILYRPDDQKCKRTSSWQSHLVQMYKVLAHQAFYFAGFGSDDKDKRIRRLMIMQPSQVINHQMDKNSITVKNYKEHIYKIVKYICKGTRCTVSESQINKDIDDMIDLEIELSSIKKTSSNSVDPNIDYQLMTIDNFQKFYDSNGGADPNAQIDWLKIIQLEMEYSGLEITKSEPIIIEHSDFFKALIKIFVKKNPRILVNYMVWTSIQGIFKLGDSKLRKIELQYQKTLGNFKGEKTRESICLDQTNLNEAFLYEYVKRHFSNDIKTKVEAILDHIIRKTIKKVESTNWIDAITKRELVLKIENIGKFIGYPEFYSVSAIDQKYRSYQLGSNYMDSMLQLIKFKESQSFAKLREPFTKDHWVVDPIKITASYVVRFNILTFSAAILQSPIFELNRPDVLNYAVFGYIAAHEISHSFGLNGLKYDRHGEARDWWSFLSISFYNSKAACFIKQFSNNYPIPELSKHQNVYTNGERTLGENMADTIALQVASDVYEEYKLSNGNIDVRLPGFENYTSIQTFFMYFASYHCTHMSPEVAQRLLKSDPHATNGIRVRGTISNHPGFGEAFNCKIGDPMHPREKCTMFN